MQPNEPLTINRSKPAKALISLVPMIDVMLILLVFFMVTSTYMNLDMIPALERSEASRSPEPNQNSDAPGDSASVLLIRLGADGVPTLRGKPFDAISLQEHLADLLVDNVDQRVLVLPSGAADMQALVSVMDAATNAGVRQLQVVRLEAVK